jgi:hypothetical protein
MEYEITFNKLDEDFEFTTNGICGEQINWYILLILLFKNS